MNRDEKNLLTRQRIVDSAFSEFSERSFGEASLNTICSVGSVSKGIIYHYFKDKDELYLVCVKECFDTLTNYLKDAVDIEQAPAEQALASYFDARLAFFAQYPQYLGVFCGAVMNPPAHLTSAIAEITAGFEAQTASALTQLLKSLRLRPDVGTEEVVEIFRQYQDFVNTRFQMKAIGERTLREHEQRCRRTLQILLYGVVDRGGELS